MLSDQAVSGGTIHNKRLIQASLDAVVKAPTDIFAQRPAGAAQLVEQALHGATLQTPTVGAQTLLGDVGRAGCAGRVGRASVGDDPREVLQPISGAPVQ